MPHSYKFHEIPNKGYRDKIERQYGIADLLSMTPREKNALIGEMKAQTEFMGGERHWAIGAAFGAAGWKLGKSTKQLSGLSRHAIRLNSSNLERLNVAIHEAVQWIQSGKGLSCEHMPGNKEGLSTAAETLLALQENGHPKLGYATMT